MGVEHFSVIETVLATLADSLRRGSVEEKVLVSLLASREESHRELNDNRHTAFLWLARDLPERLLGDDHHVLDLLGGTYFVGSN